VKVIPVGNRAFLLTVTAGDAVHLSREAGQDEAARRAVPGWHLRPRRVNARARWRAYNRAAISEPRAGHALAQVGQLTATIAKTL
jgi:hypothetical protein